MPRPKAQGQIARHRVRDEIQAMILRGQFADGDRLIQQELAKRFGVAQTVVREALLELQFSGLVKAIDNMGIFVAPLAIEQLLDAYRVRQVLEGLAARLCCERISRLDLKKMRDLAQKIHHHGKLGEYEQMATLDRQFHERTVQISGSMMLQRLVDSYRVLGMAVWAKRDIDVVYEEHRAILDAMDANDPDKADQLAQQHVNEACEFLEERVASGQIQPDWVVGDLIQMQEELTL